MSIQNYTQSIIESISNSEAKYSAFGSLVTGASYSTPNVSTHTRFMRCGAFGV